MWIGFVFLKINYLVVGGVIYEYINNLHNPDTGQYCIRFLLFEMTMYYVKQAGLELRM